MTKRGKKFRNVHEKVDRLKLYPLEEAIELLHQISFAKFDESVDIAVNLGVNPRHADQMVRGAVVLPHGTGKSVKVMVFAQGDKVQEAMDAGADYVGLDEYVEKIQKEGWLEFDKAIATPNVMGKIGKLGRILGPRGMMPNPKVGTVTFDIARAVKEAKAGKIEFKVDRTGIIHATVGKKSFPSDAISENILALIEVLQRLRPASAKGTYMKKVALSTTMSPGIKLDPLQLAVLLRG